MTRSYFTKRARHDIWETGRPITKTHMSGKNKGEKYTEYDTSKPAKNIKDTLVIKKGESYYWWKFAFGPKIISKTKPTRSQLTRSSFLSTLYSLEDSEIDDAVAGCQEDLEALVEDWVSQIESLRDECEDSLDNMPEQLKENSESGQLLQERIDGLESWISDLQNVDLEVDVSAITIETREANDGAGEQEIDELIDFAVDEKVDEILEELKNCSSGL